MKRKWLQWILGCLVLALLVGGPLAYSRHRQSLYRNFRIVEDGRVYRSGQMSEEAIQRIIKEYQIKTVLSLRYEDREGDLPPDWSEEKLCTENGIRYVRIRPRPWQGSDEDSTIPADKPVREFLNLMDDPSVYPVLIHCYAGKHRTGAYCALYRMEYQRWSNAEAMQELKAMGYATLHEEPDIQSYMEKYVPRWKRPTAEASNLP